MVYLTIISLIILMIFIFYKFFNKKEQSPEESLFIAEDRFKEYPGNYPNGWLPVMDSLDLKKSQVKPFFGFGFDLIAFRGMSGKVYVLDAYCPHLGANIGVGGTVVGEDIKCPFHGWTFNNEGKCVSVPGIESINTPKAEIKVWESIEVNGFIFVWYHSKGEKPNYVIEPIEDIHNNNFIFNDKLYNTINNRIQTVMQNSGDLNHLFNVHFKDPVLINSSKDGLECSYNLYKFFELNLKAYWEPSLIEHMSHWLVTFTIYLGLLKLPYTLDSYSSGPAYLHTTHGLFGKPLVISSTSVIHVSPNQVLLYFKLYHLGDSIIAWSYAKFVKLLFVMKIGTEDFPIWNTMRHLLAHPFYQKNDPLKMFDKWYKQFY